jgi:hypothetical protein
MQRWFVAPLDTSSPADPNSARLADAAVSHWRAIEAVLAPIIGPLGVAALYHRSLYLSLEVHPWLKHHHAGPGGAMDLNNLRDVLCGRHEGEITQATATLFRTFQELLASLVGDSLAQRLLGPLWTQLPTNTAGQDTLT